MSSSPLFNDCEYLACTWHVLAFAHFRCRFWLLVLFSELRRPKKLHLSSPKPPMPGRSTGSERHLSLCSRWLRPSLGHVRSPWLAFGWILGTGRDVGFKHLGRGERMVLQPFGGCRQSCRPRVARVRQRSHKGGRSRHKPQLLRCSRGAPCSASSEAAHGPETHPGWQWPIRGFGLARCGLAWSALAERGAHA